MSFPLRICSEVVVVIVSVTTESDKIWFLVSFFSKKFIRSEQVGEDDNFCSLSDKFPIFCGCVFDTVLKLDNGRVTSNHGSEFNLGNW